MTDLSFIRDGWIEGSLDDDDERATFTRLRIIAANTLLTRTFSKRGGGESEALNVPLLPIARYIAKMWWPLLYEPLRAREDLKFPARHRLDLPMHGYVFPAVAVCSAGDAALLVDWAPVENEFSPLRLLAASPKEPLQVARESVEPALLDLVASALERMSSGSRAHQDLAADWQRLQESFTSSSELAYCTSAGRLGIDPYDPDSPDLEMLIGDLPENLFGDISDAIDITRLADTTKWTQQAAGSLGACPTIDLGPLGKPPNDDLRLTAGEVGYGAAIEVRKRLGLAIDKPARTVGEFLGDASRRTSAMAEQGPAPMTSLIRRVNGVAHIGTVARSARQQHFRACAAAYIAWCSDPGDVRAGTVALTRRQQASRAFAAEMVAPREYLAERGRHRGFTEEDIEEEAGKLIAPYETVLWQAWRAGTTFWDVELPNSRRNYFF